MLWNILEAMQTGAEQAYHEVVFPCRFVEDRPMNFQKFSYAAMHTVIDAIQMFTVANMCCCMLHTAGGDESSCTQWKSLVLY